MMESLSYPMFDYSCSLLLTTILDASLDHMIPALYFTLLDNGISGKSFIVASNDLIDHWSLARLKVHVIYDGTCMAILKVLHKSRDKNNMKLMMDRITELDRDI